jgi:hypothetical protein
VKRHVTYRDGEVMEERFPGEAYDPHAEENDVLRRAIRDGLPFPVPILPLQPDRRMANQQSVFTVDGALAGIPFPLRVALPQIDQSRGGVMADVPVLKRIKLPSGWRREVLESLRLMNISAESIFPGLDGLGQDVALSLAYDLRLGLRDVFDERMTPRRELHGPSPPAPE